MRAVDATLACLKRAGVNAIFGLPGGPVIPLFDALHDDPDIRTFLVRHEQGAGHMAEGYAKVTGPGRGLHGHLGAGRDQPRDPDRRRLHGLGAAGGDHRPGRLHAGRHRRLPGGRHRRHHAADREALLPDQGRRRPAAGAGRGPATWPSPAAPGPVLVDVCVNQWAREVEDFDDPEPRDARLPPARRRRPPAPARGRRRAPSRRPSGRSSTPAAGSSPARPRRELTRLSEVTGIPVNTTLMGLGGFPGTHPLFVGMPGMHGIAAATYAFQASDAILAVGVRFDERVLSTVMSEWAPERQDHPHRRRPGRDLQEPGRPHRHRRPGRPGPGRAGRGLPGPARAPRRRPPGRLGGPDRGLEAPAPLPGRRRARASSSPSRSIQSIYRDHPRRRDHLHRRRPAPDVGRPALRLRPARGAGSPRAASGRWASACRPRSAPRWRCPTSWSS